MEFVTYWFSADSPADFAVKSSATPKVGGDADSLSPVRQVGMQYEARDLCGKAKGSRGSSCVHQPPLLKPLSGRHSFPQVVAESWPSQVLLCVVRPLFFFILLVTVKLITLNVNGISYPVKRVGLVRSGCVISLVRDTHITDVTEASSWFSASSLLTVIAPGTVHSCSQFIIFSCQILG